MIILTDNNAVTYSRRKLEDALGGTLANVLCEHESTYEAYLRRNGLPPDGSREVEYDQWMTKMTDRMHKAREQAVKEIVKAIFKLQ